VGQICDLRLERLRVPEVVSLGGGLNHAGHCADDVVEPSVALMVADVRHRADELALTVWCGTDVSVAGEQIAARSEPATCPSHRPWAKSRLWVSVPRAPSSSTLQRSGVLKCAW
jgi:hypothetical protein